MSAAVCVSPPFSPNTSSAADVSGTAPHPHNPTPSTPRVDAQLAARALAARPSLAQHACKQQGFGHFGDKILGTTLPHLVEHIAIDLLVEDGQGPVAGATTWLDRERGTMSVRLSCAAPAEMMYAALRRAVTLVNSLLESTEGSSD